MTLCLGTVPAGTTLYIPFSTYAGSTGASVTLTGLAVSDVEIFKNGSVTQRASDAGYALLDTDGIDFDGITGIHGFSIDLSDNTDSGFFSVGSQYWVVVSAVTVDSQTVNFIAAVFRIGPAESVAGYPKVDVSHYGGSAGTFSGGRPEVNTTHAAGTAWGSGAITSGTFAAGAIDASAIATDAIGALELAAGAASEIATAVWAESSRTLTALDEDSTTLDLDATIRAAVGLASANLDTQIAAVQADTDDIQTRIPAALVGGRMDANVGAISSDSVAADNLEAALDGTGGVTITAALTGNITGDLSGSVGSVTGAVGSVTAMVTANVIQISGDATAADNLEAAADGTGYNLGGGSVVAASVTGAVGSVTGAVGSVTGAVGSVTGNVGGNVSGSVGSVTGNVGGNVTGSVGSVATGGITRASLAADTGLQTVRSNTAQAGGATTITLDASASATDDFYNNHVVYITGGTGAGQAKFITDYVGATKVATVSTWATNPDNTSTFAILPFDAIPGASAPTAAQVADAVWDELLSGHAVSGSAGEALSAAGSAGDPWLTALPGAYGAGTAGKIIGDNLNATVSSRATQTSVDTIDGIVDSILVDTAEIGAAGAGLTAVPWNAAWDPEVQSECADALAAYDPPTNAEMEARTLVAADYATATALATVDTVADGIKAKTDNLPSDPADASDIAAAVAAIQSDTNDIQSRLPAALVDGKMDSTNSDSVIRGTIGTGSTTTSIVTSALTPAGAVADQFKGRIILFDNDTATAALRGQGSDITSSTNSATPTFTVTLLTTAPSSGDTFQVV